ncbi:MAG: ATP-binding protein, partial [Cytophagaceae bacterium]
GPSGTGKTLTATLLGQAFGMPVYVVDLSTIISKYIGETEKNLEKIFTMAENKGWVLFFDEAEALFGKRTATSSSNDRYANQEVSYLLQRIENYNGIVILASNKLFDIDEAFTRRFQTFVEFPAPNEEERLKLWENTFLKTGFTIAEDINFKELAMSKEVTGGMLINVLRYCAIRIMERGDNTLCQEDLVLGLKKEYRKERKMWVDTPQKSLPKKVLLTSLSKSTEGENIKPGTTVLHNGLE